MVADLASRWVDPEVSGLGYRAAGNRVKCVADACAGGLLPLVPIALLRFLPAPLSTDRTGRDRGVHTEP